MTARRALAGLLFLTACRGGNAAPWPAPADIAEASAVMDTMASAILRHDGTRMLSVYWPGDSVMATSKGRVTVGTKALAARYLPWDTASVWRVEFDWQDRRFEPLAADVILGTARFTWRSRDSTGAVRDSMHGAWSGVFMRNDGRWALRHEHESW
jgi:uncharacterized protein (TIGR02246 family)